MAVKKDTIVIGGGCHCGNIRFELHWPAEMTVIGARACGCTFCRKHGGRWTSNRAATLVVTIDDESAVNPYRFGTGTADFMVCRRCGVTPLVVSTIDGRDFAVVNVNTFTAGHGLDIEESSTDFDGEDEETRLARRRENWIGDVQFR